MEKRMSAAQRAYVLAKEAFDAANGWANAQLDREFPPELFSTTEWDTPEQQALIKRYSERAEEVGKFYDVAHFRDLLRQAEEHLIEWGHSRVKQMPGYTADVTAVFESHVHQRADVRRKVLDLTLRLPQTGVRPLSDGAEGIHGA